MARMADRRDLPRAAAALGAAAACLSVASGAAFAHGAVAAPGTMLRGAAASARPRPSPAGAQARHVRQAAAPAPSCCGTLAGASAALALYSAARTSARARSRASAVAVAAGTGDVSVVLLSAGVGKRMGAKIPKQYLKLLGREIALHSLEAFLDCDVKEIAIVCADEYRSIFEDYLAKRGNVKPVIKYTGGGAERQDSVCNGLAEITAEYAAVHDSARPLVTKAEIEKVIADAKVHGAALLAVQTKATIKQAKAGETMVAATPNRSLLWEAHTPQVIRSELLRAGFKNAAENKLEVTDDVSLIESLGKPVKITPGEYTNLKVTTPEDIAVAETILRERGFEV